MMQTEKSQNQPADIPQLFADHGLRCTKQRLALYQALSATKEHPTADQLHQQVGDQVEGMSLATVYNTLDAFCEANLARKIPALTSGTGGGNTVRYDATTANHLHIAKCT